MKQKLFVFVFGTSIFYAFNVHSQQIVPMNMNVNENISIQADTLAIADDTSILKTKIADTVIIASQPMVALIDTNNSIPEEKKKVYFGGYKNRDSVILRYVEKYKQIAMDEMQRSGIPAAITLAQGIIETEAGLSQLVIASNNHFGIKCKKEWMGEKVYHDDDERGECFRKYSDYKESFRDHSDFLSKSPRYQKIFKKDPLDYIGWAVGLKNAGYATNPRYSYMLKTYIEDYGLQRYTLDGLVMNKKIAYMQYKDLYNNVLFNKNIFNESIKPMLLSDEFLKSGFPKNNVYTYATKEDTINYDNIKRLIAKSRQKQEGVDSALATTHNIESEYLASKNATLKLGNGGQIERNKSVNFDSSNLSDFDPEYASLKLSINQLKTVEVGGGTSLLAIAIKYELPYHKLLEYNDLPSYSNLVTRKQILYLEPKKDRGITEFYVVREGETIYQISQNQGIKLNKLREYNYLPIGMEPKANEKIYLMYFAPVRPEAYPHTDHNM